MAAAFYQALTGMKPTFDLEYPDHFRKLMNAFKWTDFDWDQLAYPQGELAVARIRHIYLTSVSEIIPS